jgi:hypothetical protein
LTNEERTSAPAMPVRIVVQNAEAPSPMETGAIDTIASWLRAAGASWRVAVPCAALAIGAVVVVAKLKDDEREYQLLVQTGRAQGSVDFAAADLGAWVGSQATLSERVSIKAEAPARDGRLLRFRLTVRSEESEASAAVLAAAEASRIEALVREVVHADADETRLRLWAAMDNYRRSLDQLRQAAAAPSPGSVVDVAAMQELEVQLQEKLSEAQQAVDSIATVRTRLGAIDRGTGSGSPVRIAATALAAGLAGAVVGTLADAIRRRMRSPA